MGRSIYPLFFFKKINQGKEFRTIRDPATVFYIEKRQEDAMCLSENWLLVLLVVNVIVHLVVMQNQVSVLSPRVAFLDQQRTILTVGNSHLKQRIAALAQDKIFKDGE
jgi:hypothetical protein